MTDVTVANPLSTPTDGPQRDAQGTLLNQQDTQSTTKDSSTTDQTQQTQTTDTTKDQKDASTEKDGKDTKDTKTLLNKDQKDASGAPEKYEDFKLPDGLKLEPTALAEATKVFKDLNLSQAGAQSLVDFHAAQLKAAVDGPFKAVVDLKSTWENELRDTYGKDIEAGGKLNVQIGRFIDSMPAKIGTEFRAAMDATLAGSNPAFVAAMKWVSDQLAEGSSVVGKGPSPLGQKDPKAPPPSVAQAMYPHLKSQNAQS